MPQPRVRTVHIPAEEVHLTGDLTLPDLAHGVVLFAHGSGSGRLSSRNRIVAKSFNDAGLATLLIDLLTDEEEAIERNTHHLRFDIGLLADRLVAAVDWLGQDMETQSLRIGLFGASTGAGAAIVAAVQRPEAVRAIVSRGGRPDLAGDALEHDLPPTLLIVGSEDRPVISLNEQAFDRLRTSDKRFEKVPLASHLFEEPGALEEVARLGGEWFVPRLR